MRQAGDHAGQQQASGAAGGLPSATAFDGLPFQTRPLYTGNPWFLAPSVLYYSWSDSLAR